jgi:hypothetical protein
MRVDKDQIAGAETHGARVQGREMETMLRGANQALKDYKALQARCPAGYRARLRLPPDPADALPSRGTAFRDHHIPKPARSRPQPYLEDVAFWPVTELAPLIRSKAVSSTDLTRMYVARMEKYSPGCCADPRHRRTGHGAAAAADKEIRAGSCAVRCMEFRSA